MKRWLIVLMAIMFAGMAVNVQAADVSFAPGSKAITVEPGKSAIAKMVVNGSSTVPYTIYLRIGSLLDQGGNLPAGWLKPVIVSLTALGGEESSADMDLVINVPADTPAGTYSAVMRPQVMRRTTVPVNSDGATIVVDVPSMKKCDGAPIFNNVQIAPDDIWATKETTLDFDVTGTVVVAPGCDVEGTYTMESNDGPVSGDFAIASTDGSFSVTIPITVSKKGQGKEDITYNGSLTALDAEGSSAVKEIYVTVAHDRGKKLGHRYIKN
ncbi:MAG: hypothetical protein KAS94_03395 [Desulfobulbaceae bacterium]|nr:hypothetical protein [Desulfobulbaceae bacterium]